MPRYLVTTAIEADDADPTLCGVEPRCRHLSRQFYLCDLFGASTAHQNATTAGIHVDYRCPECIAATDGSPAPSRCWPSREAPR